MAKKKAKRKTARKPVSGGQLILQRIIGIVLLCFILVILGFIGISFLQGSKNKHSHKPQTAHTQNNNTKQTQQSAAVPKPKYTFYEDLAKRNKEVQEELQQRMSQDNQVKVNGRNYRIQIGAFKDKSKAEQLTVRMILRDYPVQMVNSGSLFLVQIGPYIDRDEAEKIQKQVTREGIRDSVMKAYVN